MLTTHLRWVPSKMSVRRNRSNPMTGTMQAVKVVWPLCWLFYICSVLSEAQQVICVTRRCNEIISKVSTQPELRECKSVSGFSRETRFGSKSSKAQNQIGHQMTIRGREASSSTSGSETSSDRRSETSLHGSELSLEENQDDSVFSSNLLDQTSDQSPADYDLLANLSHIEEMVVDRENERTTDQVGNCVKITINICQTMFFFFRGGSRMRGCCSREASSSSWPSPSSSLLPTVRKISQGMWTAPGRRGWAQRRAAGRIRPWIL